MIRYFIPFIIHIASFITQISSFKIHIAGITSGLGREIAYQSCIETNNPHIYITGQCTDINHQKLMIPCRSGGFEEKKTNKYFSNPRIKLYEFKDSIDAFNNYDALILSMSAYNSKDCDFSDEITFNLLQNLPKSCKTIILISAYDVNKLKKIKELELNNSFFYEIYKSKINQESYLGLIKKSNVLILRPKLLSFGFDEMIGNHHDHISRELLAKKIIYKLKKKDVYSHYQDTLQMPMM